MIIQNSMFFKVVIPNSNIMADIQTKKSKPTIVLGSIHFMESKGLIIRIRAALMSL